MANSLCYFVMIVVSLILQLAHSANLESVVELKPVEPHHKDPENHQPTDLSSTTSGSLDDEGNGSDVKQLKFISPVSRTFQGLVHHLTGKEEKPPAPVLPSGFISRHSLNDPGAKALNQLPTLSRSTSANERQGMEDFQNLQEQNQPNRIADADAQAFIGIHQSPKQEALATINPFCRHQVKDSRWLKCKTRWNGSYVTASGGSGVVIFGLLYNNNPREIKVYRNSNLKTSTGSLTDIDWKDENLVPPSDIPIPIVIKIVTRDAEENNQKIFFFADTTAKEKEFRQARITTQFKFPSGNKITPDIYDIRITSSGLAHPIHEVSYIQEQLSGADANDVLTQIIQDEEASMRHHLELTLNQFSQWLEAVKTERPGNLGQKIVAGLRRFKGNLLGGMNRLVKRRRPELTATDRQAMFKETALVFKKELWLRARNRLSLIHFILVAAVSMWEDKMFHCDSHEGNIYLIKNVIHTDEELRDAKLDGNAIILNHRVRLSDTSTTSEAEKKDLKKGITVYRLQPGGIKWIDLAFALPFEDILQQISEELGVQSPEEHLYSPCGAYRDHQTEDFFALVNFSVRAFWYGEKHYELLYKSVEGKLTKKAKRMYEKSRLPLSTHEAYLEIWKELNSAMDDINKEMLLITEKFSRMRDRLQGVYQLHHNCNSARPGVTKFLIYSIARSPQPWKRATEISGTSCSVTAMKLGAQTVLDVIEEAVDEFPPFAHISQFASA